MFFSPNGMDEPHGAPLSTPIRLRRRLLSSLALCAMDRRDYSHPRSTQRSIGATCGSWKAAAASHA